MTDRFLRLGLPRLVRGGFVALITMTLSVGAHVHAGGQAPAANFLAGTTAVFALFCWALSRRRWTARPLLAVFLLAQTATHTVAMVQHGEHSMGGAAMIPSHVVAAALLVLMVTHGEAALVRLVEHLAMRRTDLRAVPAPEYASVRPPGSAASRPDALFSITVRGRAPPRRSLLPSS